VERLPRNPYAPADPQLVIGQSAGPKKLLLPDLKEANIGTIMDNPHRIGVCPADAVENLEDAVLRGR